MEGKLGAHKAYRRAGELCDKCAEKWHRGHTCSATVQLHALQEVLDLLSNTHVDESETDIMSPEEPMVMAISTETVKGSSTKRSLRFVGIMFQQDVLILVDSGSTSSFINQDTVIRLGLVTVAATPIQIQVANGGILACSTKVPLASWCVQGCHFVQDLQVLSLSTFDIILGMDWLEQFSPMRVHWQHKWLSIPYLGKQVVLLGYFDQQPTNIMLHISHVSVPGSSLSDNALHPAVSTLLSQFHLSFPFPLLCHQ